MIRTLCFLVAVCCCIGLISGSYTAILDTGDDVTFTEEVLLGDPSVLDGRVAEFGVCYGEHLFWDFTCRFGAEDSYETSVSFSQKGIHEYILNAYQPLNVYGHSGWGASTTGDMQLSEDGYGAMFGTVAALTQRGTEGKMNLRLADFVEYHALNFELNYQSDRYICNEYEEHFSYITGLQAWEDSPSYEAFSQLFRFPVQEDDIVTISVWVNEAGGLASVDYYTNANYTISVVSCATDAGVYCIPSYWNDSTGTAIPGEYAQGMGMYFIPWKEYDDGSVYAGGKKRVTLDVDNAKNVCPMPENAITYGLTMDEESETVWLLSQEDGQYLLTRLDLQTNQVLDRIELMNLPDHRTTPEWYICDDLMLIQAADQIALVSTGDTPALEFIAPTGDTTKVFHSIESKTTAMVYEDGLLYLADARYYDEYLSMLVFDENGPVYWGRYHCSLFECNELGGSQLQMRVKPTVLE